MQDGNLTGQTAGIETQQDRAKAPCAVRFSPGPVIFSQPCCLVRHFEVLHFPSTHYWTEGNRKPNAESWENVSIISH